jgi:hypothetical protein
VAVSAPRVLAWIAVYAITLRTFGAALGIWAAGSLSAFASLLFGVVAPVWCFLFGPSWLAWRVLHPLGRGRLRALVRAACWLSPLARARDLPSIGIFLDVAAGRPFPAAGVVPVDAWTALAAVAQADRQRSAARAERIIDGLAHLPDGSRFPWLARVHGVDALVADAIRRGDGAAAARVARIGRGPLALLLATVANRRAGQPVPAAVCWLRWAIAPMRRRTLSLVRAALRPPAPVAAIPPPAAPTPVEGARLQHVRLLAAAAREERVTLAEVFALAGSWQGELDDAALAHLRARALELGARDGEARARALRDTVLGELVELAQRATGDPPASLRAASPFVRELAGRIRERLVERAQAAVAPLNPRTLGSPPAALDAWERWLVLRAALDDVELHAGLPGLAPLWYGGVRDAVWGSSSALLAEPRGRSAWAAHMMFAWVADRAEVLGDFPTTLANRENARSALVSLR